MTLGDMDRKILTVADNNGYYRPSSRQGFERAQKLVRLALMDASDIVPGAYSLTVNGEKLLSAMEQKERL